MIRLIPINISKGYYMTSTHTANQHQAYTYRFLLPDIMCGNCENTIEKRLLTLPGISRDNIEVNYKEKIALVKVAPHSKITSWQIQHVMAEQDDNSAKAFSSSILESKKEYTIKDRKDHLKKALISLGLGIPLILLCFAGLFPPVTTLFGQIIWAAIGSTSLVNTIYAGKEIFHQAWEQLRQRKIHVPALITISVTAALCLSFAVVAFPAFFPPMAQHLYFDVAFMLIGFKHLGDYLKKTTLARINRRTRETTSKSSRSDSSPKVNNQFYKLFPKVAHMITNDFSSTTKKSIFDIQVGNRVVVKPGKRIPLDGKIVNISSRHKNRYSQLVYVSNELSDGNNKPKRIEVGTTVYTGAINESRKPIIIEVTNIPENSKLNERIITIEIENRTPPPKFNTLINKINHYFIPAILVTTLLTASFWLFLGPSPVLPFLLSSTLSVLAITCPCSVVLAPTIANKIGINMIHDNKISVRNASNTIPKTHATDTIVFDVNGTLTHEVATANMFYPTKGDTDSLLYYAACIEKKSPHPYAKAIVAQYQKAYRKPLKDIETIEHDNGLECKLDGKHILIGQLELLTNKGVMLSTEQNSILKDIYSKAASPVFMSIDGKIAAIFGISNTLRAEAKTMIEKLKEKKKTIILASGADKTTVTHVAKKLGIKNDPKLAAQGIKNINYDIRPEISIKSIKTKQNKKDILNLAASLIVSTNEKKTDPLYKAVYLAYEKNQAIPLKQAKQININANNIQGCIDGNIINIKKQIGTDQNSQLTIEINHQTVATITMQPTKKQLIKKLKKAGRQVMMVGDAFNDAEVLADKSAITVAMGHGDERCRKLADITLKNGLWDLFKTVEISEKVMTRIHWALGLSLAYNLVAIPMAALALFNPAIAAAAMLALSVTVSITVASIKWRNLTEKPIQTTIENGTPKPFAQTSTNRLIHCLEAKPKPLSKKAQQPKKDLLFPKKNKKMKKKSAILLTIRNFMIWVHRSN